MSRLIPHSTHIVPTWALAGTIRKWTDENGDVVFGDAPVQGGHGEGQGVRRPATPPLSEEHATAP